MKKFYALLFLSLVFMSTGILAQTVRYVKAGATGNGESWASASGDLQAMINVAVANDEIWVAAGTYFPTEKLNATLSDGITATTDRDKTFIMRTGVKVYGGFAGTETTLAQRNFATNVTIISGDLGVVGNRTDNAYHLIASKNVSIGAAIDGFTLQDAYANGTGTVYASGTLGIPQNSGAAIATRGAATNIEYKNLIIKNNESTGLGGAVFLYISATTASGTGLFNFTNVQFLNNKGGGTTEGGGAMYINRSSGTTTVSIIDSKFEGNSSTNSGGAIYYGTASSSFLNITNTTFEGNIANAGSGGAVYFTTGTLQMNKVTFTANRSLGSSGAVFINSNTIASKLTDVTFMNNTSSTTAGALYISSSSPTITNAKFIGNKAGTNGGAIFTFGSAPIVTSPVFTNALFYNNESANTTNGGGAIFASSSTSLSLINSTLYGNKATAANGGALILGATSATVNIYNTIIYGNTAALAGEDIQNNSNAGTVNIKHSLTQIYGIAGVNGNKVGEDPNFLSVDDKSTNFLYLQDNGPAVDEGNGDFISPTITTDLAGNKRVNNLTVDMGAYEYAGAPGVPPLSVTLTENSAAGILVAQPLSTLPGVVGNWIIESGNVGDAFTINAVTGAIRVLTSASLDYETRQTFSLKLKVSNATDEQNIRVVITLTNLMEDPGAPVITNVVNNVLTSFKPKLTGIAEPSSTITLYIDGQVYPITALSDNAGNWKLDLTEELKPGLHSFYVIASNSINGTSRPGPTVQVTLKLYSGMITPNNILTPNGDGKNDVWKIDNLTSMYPKNEVIIYDKVGRTVYRKQNYEGDWDGTYQGQILATGSYYYEINVGSGLDRIKGMITIIKGR